VLIFDRLRPGARSGDGYLTIIGSVSRYFGEGPNSVLEVARSLCPRLTVERYEVEGDEAQLRVHLHRVTDNGGPQLVSDLNSRLPDCQISYVDARSLT
jgi:hypothetical protein